MEALRKCKCGVTAYTEEELEEFVPNKKSKHGRSNTCKSCRQTKVREYLSNNPIIKHDIRVRKAYGVTGDEYNTLMETSVICECCGTNDNLVYDHCHIIGKGVEAFRGVLCQKCNAGIGLLGDNLDGLLNAVNYLQKKEK